MVSGSNSVVTVNGVPVVGYFEGNKFHVETILDKRRKVLGVQESTVKDLKMNRKIYGVVDNKTGRILVTSPGYWPRDKNCV